MATISANNPFNISEEALLRCEQEPIRTPGSIQSWGTLIVLNAETQEVVHCAANVADWVDIDSNELLGKPAELVLPSAIMASISSYLQQEVPVREVAFEPARMLFPCGKLVANIHKYNGNLYLELSPLSESVSNELMQELILDRLIGIPGMENHAINVESYCQHIAEMIRDWTGYDRTMIYRFDEQFNGQVIAEARRTDLMSYLHLWFPSTDIPAKARELYQQCRVRVLGDVMAPPVQLIPTRNSKTGEELDLSFCRLRSMSPMHLAYLNNMGVRATLVLSVMKENRLWGLIACHHYAPYVPSWKLVESCHFLARLLSAQVHLEEQAALANTTAQAHQLHTNLIRRLANCTNWDVELSQVGSQFTSVVPADGIAIVHEGAIYRFGNTPTKEEITKLITWIQNTLGRSNQSPTSAIDIFACDDLGKRNSKFDSFREIASGVLARILSEDGQNALMWFRVEKTQQKRWAGNPATGIQIIGGCEQLTPRRSFEVWETEVRGSSLPWSREDKQMASVVAVSWTEIVLRTVRLQHQMSRLDLLRVRKAVEVVQEAILIENLDQTIAFVNNEAQSLIGYTPQDLSAQGGVASLMDSPDKVAELRKQLRTDEKNWKGEVILRTKTEELIPVYAQVNSVPGEKIRDSIGIVYVFKDLRESRRIETELRTSREVAEKANAAKSEFLSRTSHELRTPLNAILGFAQILQMEKLPESINSSVKHILRAGRHLLELINEVLEISKIESGRMDLSIVACQALEAIEESIVLLRKQGEMQSIEILIDRTTFDGMTIRADRQRLRQILLNLISNAIKYNRPEGKVYIRGEKLTNNKVSLQIQDTGLGIAFTQLSRLYEPFDRLGMESSDIEGTGLGLMLSKRLIQAMGGTIQCDSQVGVGTTFTVTLPAGNLKFVKATVEQPPSMQIVSTSSLILLVEDNIVNAHLLDVLFRNQESVQLITAMQGSLGLELAQQHQPALILLDVHLPDMKGDEFIRRLKMEEATAMIPVVIVSADANPELINRLWTLGIKQYLTKPLNLEELLDVVQSILQHSTK